MTIRSRLTQKEFIAANLAFRYAKVRTWISIGIAIVILIAAAVLSPTNDIPNMLLFAAPMIVLYLVSIFVAWIFNRPRRAV